MPLGQSYNSFPLLSPIDSLGNLHGLGVYEAEEEDVGCLLLILVEPRVPFSTCLIATHCVICQSEVDAKHLLRIPARMKSIVVSTSF